MKDHNGSLHGAEPLHKTNVEIVYLKQHNGIEVGADSSNNDPVESSWDERAPSSLPDGGEATKDFQCVDEKPREQGTHERDLENISTDITKAGCDPVKIVENTWEDCVIQEEEDVYNIEYIMDILGGNEMETQEKRVPQGPQHQLSYNAKPSYPYNLRSCNKLL